MSGNEMGAPQGVPIEPTLEPKTFVVTWTDRDIAVSYYSGITGSHLDGNLLFLMSPDGTERILNLDHITGVIITNDDPDE